MMIADTSGKSSALYGFPKIIFPLIVGVIHGDNAALRAVIGLMGGTGDNVRPFLKGLLKLGADQSQYMGHIVHDHTVQRMLINNCP